MKATLHFRYEDVSETSSAWHPGTLQEFINEYAYVEYGGKTYEMVTYQESNEKGVDYEAFFSNCRKLPPGVTDLKYVYRLPRLEIRCECGKDKAGDNGKHSSWCPKSEKKPK